MHVSCLRHGLSRVVDRWALPGLALRCKAPFKGFLHCASQDCSLQNREQSPAASTNLRRSHRVHRQ